MSPGTRTGKPTVGMGSRLRKDTRPDGGAGREPRLLGSSSITDGALALTLLVCELGQMT